MFPRPGGRVWYDDQREVHRQIFEGDDAIDYAFMGNDPNAADNQWLRAAYENRIPVIYFLGIAPGRYQAIVPVYVAGWDAKALKARIAFGAPDQQELVAPQDVQERRYALRTVKQRLHQASFREAVISAYRGRCSLSGLPEKRLLDAAHIIPDANEQLGQPVVPNGLPLSKIHHAAFDAYLIGIDPDYRVHVSDRLLGQHDGKMLEALKLLDGGKIHLPRRSADFRIGIGWRSGMSYSAGQRSLRFGGVSWLGKESVWLEWASMDAQDKNRLAELIEQLPEEEIQAAVRYLEYLKDRGDPYLKFLMSVPEEDEELTDEFQRELDRAWKDIDDGQVISSDQLKQELEL